MEAGRVGGAEASFDGRAIDAYRVQRIALNVVHLLGGACAAVDFSRRLWRPQWLKQVRCSRTRYGLAESEELSMLLCGTGVFQELPRRHTKPRPKVAREMRTI